MAPKRLAPKGPKLCTVIHHLLVQRCGKVQWVQSKMLSASTSIFYPLPHPQIRTSTFYHHPPHWNPKRYFVKLYDQELSTAILSAACDKTGMMVAKNLIHSILPFLLQSLIMHMPGLSWLWLSSLPYFRTVCWVIWELGLELFSYWPRTDERHGARSRSLIWLIIALDHIRPRWIDY